MKKTEALTCLFLGNLLNNKEIPAEIVQQLTKEEWEDVAKISSRHNVDPLVLESVLKMGKERMPEDIFSILQARTLKTTFQYYQMYSFARKIVTMFELKEIPYVILKGFGLNRLYPREELRKMADIDIYIWDKKSFSRACCALEEEGFKALSEEARHHIVYCYFDQETGRRYFLELHRNVAASFQNESVDQEIISMYSDMKEDIRYETVMDLAFPVLEPTKNAVYLLLHMLMHFGHTGFGLRQLCDWSVFLKEREREMDIPLFLHYVRKLSLSSALCLTTGLCVRYLGLSGYYPWMEENSFTKEELKAYMNDILNGGEFGRADQARMRCSKVKSKDQGMKLYCRELHYQMKARYPVLQNYRVLWPFLWISTFYIFYREEIIRKDSSLHKKMKSFQKRNRLYDKLAL